jgi:hypothetical protein
MTTARIILICFLPITVALLFVGWVIYHYLHDSFIQEHLDDAERAYGLRRKQKL